MINKEDMTTLKDLISHYYVKFIGFAVYLILIILVSFSSAYFQMQINDQMHIEEEATATPEGMKYGEAIDISAPKADLKKN